MKTLKLKVVDHLGNDFDTQGLIERKKRIDAQIVEHARLYSISNLSDKEEHLIASTFIQLMKLQKDLASKISFLSHICLN